VDRDAWDHGKRSAALATAAYRFRYARTNTIRRV